MTILDNIYVIAAVFGLFALIIALINKWSKSYSGKKVSVSGKKIYACGEDVRPRSMEVPEQSLYSSLVKSLKVEKMRAWHSGDLTRYLVWIFTGMVLLMAYFMLLWQI